MNLENNLSHYDEDSSDEETSDEVYETRHAFQEKEEIQRIVYLLNPRLNKNKTDSKRRDADAMSAAQKTEQPCGKPISSIEEVKSIEI